MSLLVNEIFYSILGESTRAGLPCCFIRLTGCNLRCSYCDTTYAYEEGQRLSIEEILAKVGAYNTTLVEVTGGEPLYQEETVVLMHRLLERGYAVLLETNGSLPLEGVDRRVLKIMDIKCPGSGMHLYNHYENIKFLDSKDEVKFVIVDRHDYDWAKEIAQKHRLFEGLNVLFSPAFDLLSPRSLAEWMLADRLPARLNLQLHKYIWGSDVRGV